MVIDVLVVLMLVVALVGGLRAGLFSSLGALGGLLAGGLVIPWIVPPIIGAIPDPSLRWPAAVGLIAVLLVLGASVGSTLGSLFRRGADRLRLKGPERLLGGVASTVVAAVILSIVGTGVASAGIPGLSSAVSSSSALRTMDDVLPDRILAAGDRVRTALLDDPFLPSIPGTPGPSVPAPDGNTAPPPDVDSESPALMEAAESVAQISGIAQACRTMPTGSGFVVADNRVVTNAHVVAGVDSPVVTLPGGRAADGEVVYFNEGDDIAVISVDIDARPLPVSSGVSPGDIGVVQGYPGGGTFQSVPARVVSSGPAQFGNRAEVPTGYRSVVRLATEVVPGNSGGPFLTTDGEVAGVVFARDEVNPSTGYAVTVDALDRAATAFADAAVPVPTGQCAA